MTDESPAPAPTSAPAPTPAPAAPPPAAWHGLPDTDQAGLAYVANKGWKGPADVIQSYQGAEKLIGRDPNTLVPIPRPDDPAALRSALTKFGLPATPDKYEFAKPPEGIAQDENYVAFARGAFHDIGLLPGQATRLTDLHNQYVANVLQKQAADYALSVDTDKKALLSEWGGGHERMMNAAKTAAKALGFDAQTIDAIERERGYAGTWKFFAELGKKLGEPGFVDSKAGSSFSNATLTPDEARIQWQQLQNDPVWKKEAADRTHPNHEAAAKKQKALFAIMYPDNK